VVGYVLRRLAFSTVQVLFVAVATFLLLRVLPADPAAKLIGINPSKESYALARHALGLDASIWTQLTKYLGQLLTGNLGTSWDTSRSVATEIAQRYPITLQFVVPAFLLAIIVAVPVGLLVASRPGGRLDRFVLGYSLFAGAQPDFWWGLMFIFVLYFVAHIFPAPLGLLDPIITAPKPVTNFVLIDSLIAGEPDVFLNALGHLALPIFTLAFVLSGPIIKMTRQSAEAVFNSDFILYARACGFPEAKVRRQMLRIAVAPVLTLVGILFGFMLGGAVLIENVFSLNGLGTYALQRTLSLDFPAVQGAVVVMTAFALGVYLVMDLAHSLLDPRVVLR
jgi:peptide/nickel transport system permease protein